MNDVFYKPSLSVNSLVNENSSIDSERFQLFLEAYYEWLQNTIITLKDTTGTFVSGETISGSISGATGKVIQVTSTTLVVKITSERKVFNQYETITGQTSNATSTVYSIKDNVVRASGNVSNYKHLETSIDKYVSYLKDELYPSLPASFYGDKRLIAKHFKDFFQSKGTEQSYRFLFRLLYNQEIEFYYPGEDLLRVSAGNFEKTQVIRANPNAFGFNEDLSTFDRNIFSFLNKTIVGATTGYLANVVDIKKFFVGSIEVAEMTLKLVSGTFNAGERIFAADDINLITTIYGIISGFNIIDGGSGYQPESPITINGDGYSADAVVSSIQQSPITSLKINSIGHGYRLGTLAYVNNTGTGGSGLIVQVTEIANTYTTTIGANTYTLGEISKISIINRGSNYYKKPTISLQDSLVSTTGLLTDKLITISNPGTNYGVGNTLIFSGGSGTSAAGVVASVTESTTYDLLFEDGYQIKVDGSYYDIIKNEDWRVTGPIKRIELTNFGTGYSSTNLPSISISTTTGVNANLIITGIQGTSASVTVDSANNKTGIGSIRSVKIKNFGVNYTYASANVSIIGDGNANLIPIVSGLGIKDGDWLNDDGKIDYKIIQDSYYYQDYSYVIRSGLAFAEYSDTLKKTIHPAGLQFFGRINILNEIDVRAYTFPGVNKVIYNILYILYAAVAVPQTSKYKFIFQSTKQLNADFKSTHYDVIFKPNISPSSNVAETKTSILTRLISINPSLNSTVDKKFIISSISSTGAYDSEATSIYYKDLLISQFASNLISQFANTKFSTLYSRNDFSASNTIDKYVKIAGTVSSVNVSSSSAVFGTGTNFTTSYSANSVILANNEYFKVVSVTNTNLLFIDRYPANAFSSANAYKILI